MELSAAVEIYLDYIKTIRRLAKNTVTARRRHLAWFVAWTDNRDVTAVKQSDCESFYSHKSQTNCIAGQFDIMVSVKGFFRYCAGHDLIVKSPAEWIPYPRITRRKPRIINETQAAQILDWQQLDDTARGRRNTAVISLAYGAGLRRAELSNIRLKEIDLQERTCYLSRSKWGVDRYAYFPEPVAVAIARYLAVRSEILNGRKDTGYLFVSSHSSHLCEDSVAKIVKSAATANSLSWVHTHILRHSFATHLLNHGTDIETLRMAMGHSSLNATGVYLQVANKDVRNNIQRNHPLQTRIDRDTAVRQAAQIVDRGARF